MVTHMKTTVDIADALFESARRAAARENTTFRALIEEGLRMALDRRRGKATSFTLRDASFTGDGLRPGIDLSDWDQLRALVYEGRDT
jgi:hypothetical protein